MAKITWTDESRRWLEDIFEYIAADNPSAADATVQGIFERAQALAHTILRWVTDTRTRRGRFESCNTGTFASPI